MNRDHERWCSQQKRERTTKGDNNNAGCPQRRSPGTSSRFFALKRVRTVNIKTSPGKTKGRAPACRHALETICPHLAQFCMLVEYWERENKL
jgi:hypothetical protein